MTEGGSLWQRIGRLFRPCYSVTVTIPQEGVTAPRIIEAELRSISKLSTRHIRGRDCDGLLWELKTRTEFDYEIRQVQ